MSSGLKIRRRYSPLKFGMTAMVTARPPDQALPAVALGPEDVPRPRLGLREPPVAERSRDPRPSLPGRTYVYSNVFSNCCPIFGKL